MYKVIVLHCETRGHLCSLESEMTLMLKKACMVCESEKGSRDDAESGNVHIQLAKARQSRVWSSLLDLAMKAFPRTFIWAHAWGQHFLGTHLTVCELVGLIES